SLHPGRMLPLLDKARFINDQHGVSITNMLYYVPVQVLGRCRFSAPTQRFEGRESRSGRNVGSSPALLLLK
ncbi:hypothetical protein, partial [Cupriavidus necator]|uniref:hypothetical protein n=1 Tax=Cupriavidus necator TaxID=106590 RepID=UPI001F43998A